MTLDQVAALRDKYFNALLDYDVNKESHSIGDASYQHDQHRESLQKSFEYWDNLYNVKASVGGRLRVTKKAT